MDSIQLKKFAQVIANDEKLQIRLANANSMEEIRNMLKNIVGIQSDKDAEDFLRKAYHLGSSKQILTDDQLSKVSGGLSIKNFMLICIGGIASLCIMGPLMSNLNVAHAYDSGGVPISYEGTSRHVNVGDSKEEGQLARSDTVFQAAHERITVTCYACSVGAEAPPAMNRSDIKPEAIQAELNKIPKKQTSMAAQQVSEATKQEGAAAASAAAATGETEPKGIPEGLEQGSYWNDMFSTNYVVFLNSFANRDKDIEKYQVGEETKSYVGDVNNEIEHLLINLAKSDGSTECRTKFSHNYRGNYLHCMQMHEADGTRPASQSDTYKCVMKWLEFAVAFGKVGSCVDIKQEDCKAIVGNKNDDEAKRKIDACVKDGKKLFGEEPDIAAIRCVLSNPEMKVLIMSDKDIISYAKKYVVGQGTDAKFDETFEKSLRNVVKKYGITKLKNDANRAGVILLAEKLMMDELKKDVANELMMDELEEDDSDSYGELLKALLNKISQSSAYERETTLKNRAVGMACHTIEDSFNPSHCDRHMTYTSDEKGKVTGVTYGGIKSFMDYAVQGYNHAKFDKISAEDFTKNLVGSPSNQSQIKTVGLKQVVEIVTQFLEKMYGGKDGSKYENAMGIMTWISKNVIYFDEQIARVEGYRPYAASGDVKLNGTGETYKTFVTTAGGSLVSSVDCSSDPDYAKQYDLFLSTNGLIDDAVKAINYLKLLLNTEREAVLHQDFDIANLCARFIKTILKKEGEDIAVRISAKLSRTFSQREVSEVEQKVYTGLLQLYRDYNLGKDIVEDVKNNQYICSQGSWRDFIQDDVLQVNETNILRLASESKLRNALPRTKLESESKLGNALQGIEYADYRFQDSLGLEESLLSQERYYYRERQLSLAKLEERALYNYTNCKSQLDKLMRDFMRSRVEHIKTEYERAVKSFSEVKEDDLLAKCNTHIEQLRKAREKEPGWVNRAKEGFQYVRNQVMDWLHLEQKEPPGKKRELRSGWGKYNESMKVGENGYRVRSYQSVENMKKLQQEQLREASLESLWWDKVKGRGEETKKFLQDRLELVKAIEDGSGRIPKAFQDDTRDYFKNVHKGQWKQYRENPQQLFEKVGIEGGIINWEGFSELVLETLEAFYPEEDLTQIPQKGRFGRTHLVPLFATNLQDFNTKVPKNDQKKNMAQRVLFVLKKCINSRLEQSEKSKDNIRQVLGGGKTVAICFAHAMDEFCSGEDAKQSCDAVSQIMNNVCTYIDLRDKIIGPQTWEILQKLSEDLRQNPSVVIDKNSWQKQVDQASKKDQDGDQVVTGSSDAGDGDGEFVSRINIGGNTGDDSAFVATEPAVAAAKPAAAAAVSAVAAAEPAADVEVFSRERDLEELKRRISEFIPKWEKEVDKYEGEFLALGGTAAAADAEAVNSRIKIIEELRECMDDILGFIKDTEQAEGPFSAAAPIRGDVGSIRMVLDDLKSKNLSVSAPVLGRCLQVVLDGLNSNGAVQPNKEEEIKVALQEAVKSAWIEEKQVGIFKTIADQYKTASVESYKLLIRNKGVSKEILKEHCKIWLTEKGIRGRKNVQRDIRKNLSELLLRALEYHNANADILKQFEAETKLSKVAPNVALAKEPGDAQEDFQGLSLRGLPNVGNTCFMNAAIQQLYRYEEFKTFVGFAEAINQELDETDEAFEKRQGLMLRLKNVFEYLEHGGGDIQRLRDDLTKINKEVMDNIENRQEDVHEFMSRIFRITYFSGSSMYQKHEFYHEGKLLSTQYENAPTVMFELSLDDKLRTVRGCLDEYFRDTDIMYTLKDKKIQAQKHPRLTGSFQDSKTHEVRPRESTELSKTLILSLKRYRYSERSRIKISTEIELDHTLYLTRYCDDTVSGSKQYKLVGIICHTGDSANGGHYVSYVRQGDQWYLIDDATISLVDPAVLTREDLKQNAYILRYERIDSAASE